MSETKFVITVGVTPRNEDWRLEGVFDYRSDADIYLVDAGYEPYSGEQTVVTPDYVLSDKSYAWITETNYFPEENKVKYNLMKQEDVVRFMKESKNEQDYNNRANSVYNANNGYPYFWYMAMEASGLADKIFAGFRK